MTALTDSQISAGIRVCEQNRAASFPTITLGTDLTHRALTELRTLRSRVAVMAGALRELLASGVIDTDPRLKYVELQVSRETLTDARAALHGSPEGVVMTAEQARTAAFDEAIEIAERMGNDTQTRIATALRAQRDRNQE
jgi:hypothetical protein